MQPFEENAASPENPAPEQRDLRSEVEDGIASNSQQATFKVDPNPVAASREIYSPARVYPEDLRISWSWPHLILFILFGCISLIVVQGTLAYIYLPHEKMPQKQMEEYLISKPQFAIGSMLIWYATIFFFLYVTLSILRGHPFWKTLGWRKLVPLNKEMPKNPLIYFFAGCGLSLIVAIATAGMKAPENAPIEQLFKNRHTALLFVGMAVLVAPLVEETLFRGYLYPMFARWFGIGPGILVTGLLFGLMHGAQLGWTWSLVTMLVAVGVVFTIVRARTGTVFASFLMHLGYNSLISVAALLSTHGFTKLPVGK